MNKYNDLKNFIDNFVDNLEKNISSLKKSIPKNKNTDLIVEIEKGFELYLSTPLFIKFS